MLVRKPAPNETDQQGSVVSITNSAVSYNKQQRYMPFGQIRIDVVNSAQVASTDFGYTGQRSMDSIGLMDYNARFYDPF